MLPFASGFFLLLWVVAGVLGTGLAILHRLTTLRGLALLAYGAGAGVVLHGIVGCWIGIAPHFRMILAVALIAIQGASLLYLLWAKALQEFSKSLTSSAKIAVAIWFALLVTCLGLMHLEVRYPAELPDGIYISKAHTTNVKMQYLNGMAADNFLPCAVAEFIVRGVPFRKVRPLLPGNEVANRTVLMSLVTVPFRVALGAPRDHPQIGSYLYLQHLWPDIWQLNSNFAFDEFAVIGMTLNSFLLFGVLVFVSSFGMQKGLGAAAALACTNPFFLNQTIFTWPKSLAGFFILLAWTSVRLRHGPILAALLMAAAFHSHPYAIIFAIFLGTYYLVRLPREGSRPLLKYVFAFALGVAPWFVWTKIMLRIPSSLITQNVIFSQDFSFWEAALNHVWVRIANLGQAFSPVMLTVFPFHLDAVLGAWMFSWLPSLLGVVIFLPALRQSARLTPARGWFWCGLVGPFLVVFLIPSFLALPIFLGCQPIVGVLLFLGVWWLREHHARPVFFLFLALQIVINLTALLLRGVVVGAHFS